METARIAQVLDDMGTILEIQGENPFRCRAYHNAAQTLQGLPADLTEMIADGSLAEVQGIGETLYAKIVQLATTGRLPAYDKLRAETPPGLLALLRISGIGPKKIKALREELQIESLADLRAAAEAGKIAKVKGFGAKTEANILEGISFVETTGGRILQHHALALVEPILATIRDHPQVIRAEVCGSLRRRAETIGDLDILFSAHEPGPVLDDFVALPQVAKILGHGPTKASVLLPGFKSGQFVQCDVRGVADDQFAFALHYFTGSKAHNIAVRKRALAQGLSLNEYALTGKTMSIACRDEADVFQALKLEYIPPELREDSGEIEAAENGKIPKLVELSDLSGTFHCHSDWSDGEATLEQMAEGAKALGLHYLGIADHSRSLAMARGLSIERVYEQWKAIDALNEKLGSRFRLFKGTECDILADGSLDYPDEVLAGFDYVVASVHSRFKMPRDEMTARIVKAVSNPHVTMLGHATGRLLLSRAPYEVDLDAVIEAAAKNETMIEINASPYRLDMDATHCRRARKKGVTIVVNPDAHSVAGLNDLSYGVDVARRAWFTADDLFNTVPLAEVARRLERLRNRAK
ncbi:MAG: DNA polymerase/3'-5' exonuclease PolX [Paludisphaera borealis]|uniref:DNA polymerase/3'-5' exonuclease PolX n=1 Tax=Paludisphaera borealis TaxID=1387353 RepID=UPI00283F66E5|nr:DNA polymerase/3'-5' exonuclease PolX [Paludisphaera borealis]MDR3619503.1 DNA polymerase/3'-5' exonuclease PolX [Paludisphaera borealis]